MIHVLVTGATGFIGRELLVHMSNHESWALSGIIRNKDQSLPDGVKPVFIPDISNTTDWGQELIGIDVVIHAAARVHRIGEKKQGLSNNYILENTEPTLRLARAAAQSGVKRIVFLSSIGVNGNQTFGKPFRADDIANPHTDYAVSKHEAERGLLEISKNDGLEVVIIRPPLVYGANAPGNYRKLLSVMRKGIPLPLNSVDNLRSFVYSGNLVSLIETCIWHPKASNQIFLVSDDEDMSTSDLLRRTAIALGKTPRLFSFPVWILKIFAHVVGQTDAAKQLFGSLQIEVRKTRELLGWKPVFTVDEAFNRIAKSK